jgi:hypothetical protein
MLSVREWLGSKVQNYNNGSAAEKVSAGLTVDLECT